MSLLNDAKMPTLKDKHLSEETKRLESIEEKIVQKEKKEKVKKKIIKRLN